MRFKYNREKIDGIDILALIANLFYLLGCSIFIVAFVYSDKVYEKIAISFIVFPAWILSYFSHYNDNHLQEIILNDENSQVTFVMSRRKFTIDREFLRCKLGGLNSVVIGFRLRDILKTFSPRIVVNNEMENFTELTKRLDAK